MGGSRIAQGIVVAGVVACLVVTGCASKDDDEGGASGASTTTIPLEPEPGGKLVYATDSDVDGWNTSSSAWPPRAHTVARAVMDPLTIIDKDGNWQPFLAESFTPNENFTVWSIKLRPGIEFHDGTPLDADALKLNLDTIVGGLVSSSAFVDVVDVRKVDEMTVEVEVAEPWSQFPSLLSDQPGYIMAPSMIEAGGAGAEAPVGTGPFVFEEWVRDDHISFVRNDNYWQEGLPYLDSVEFRPLVDPSSQLAALKAGDLGALISIAGGTVEQLPEIEAEGELVVQPDEGPTAEAVIMFNFESEIGGNDTIRQAMAQAIDPQAVVDGVYDGQFEVANQPYEPGDTWYVEDLDSPQFDPAAASALVEEYEAENGPIEISVLGVANSDSLGVLQLVQQQLEAVGIDMEIDSQEVVAFTQTFIRGDWDIILIGSFFRTADPDNEYHFMHGKNAAPELAIKLNFPRFRNDVVDAALDAARASNDPAERQAEYAKIWQTYADELPFLFLYHTRTAAIARPEVHGLGDWTTPDGDEIPAINGSAQWVTRAWVEQ